ncbi:universal stress protein [Flavisericum labens]|uniref:universal stress protein n=1 Tax=Flavisericum labens TaxID=3377112 RepID=UPI00387AF838
MKNKYKIVVLSDLKDSSEKTLKSSISLAKTIGADIKFFHVKKPTDVVDRDSQLSTFRTINEQHSLTKNSIDDLVKSVSKTYGVPIDYGYAFGNVKTEIQDYLDKHQPDIVVLGKRKSKIGLTGDKIVNFVLKTHKGTILVVGNQNNLEPDEDLSIGFLNNHSTSQDDALTNSLLKKSQKPSKAFRFIDKSKKQESSKTNSDNKTIEYVFERNDNTIKNLSNYLLKSNINLLYLNRKENKNKNGGLRKSDIKDILAKVDVSMLLSSEQTL